jgi:hypothetical protein
MGPTTQGTAEGAPQSEAARTTTADDGKAARARQSGSAGYCGRSGGPDAVITGVLGAALLFGLIGLAAHFLWIVAIIKPQTPPTGTGSYNPNVPLPRHRREIAG